VTFLHSKFSPFGYFIKKEPQLLKDVLSFVQTNLVKLYVEQGDKRAIYNFFANHHPRKQIFIDHQEVQNFLDRETDTRICNITMALLLEQTGQNTKALDRWMQLQSEEGCSKTVSILRKSSITSNETIFKYLKWVLIKNPLKGLSLFFERNPVVSQTQSTSGISFEQQSLEKSQLSGRATALLTPSAGGVSQVSAPS
jgi:hypothetical protein